MTFFDMIVDSAITVVAVVGISPWLVLWVALHPRGELL